MLSLTNELRLKCIHMMMIEENCATSQKAKFPVRKMRATIGPPAKCHSNFAGWPIAARDGMLAELNDILSACCF